MLKVIFSIFVLMIFVFVGVGIIGGIVVVMFNLVVVGDILVLW